MCTIANASAPALKAAEQLTRQSAQERGITNPGERATMFKQFYEGGAPQSESAQPAAPVNPQGMAMAGMAAAKAGVNQFQAKPMKIADSFLGTTAQPTKKPESGYKVVG